MAQKIALIRPSSTSTATSAILRGTMQVQIHRLAADEKLSDVARSYGCSTSDIVLLNPHKESFHAPGVGSLFTSLEEHEPIYVPVGVGDPVADFTACLAASPCHQPTCLGAAMADCAAKAQGQPLPSDLVSAATTCAKDCSAGDLHCLIECANAAQVNQATGQPSSDMVAACAANKGVSTFSKSTFHTSVSCNNGKTCSGSLGQPLICTCPPATGSDGPPNIPIYGSPPVLVCDPPSGSSSEIVNLCNTSRDPVYCFFAKQHHQAYKNRGSKAAVTAWIAWGSGNPSGDPKLNPDGSAHAGGYDDPKTPDAGGSNTTLYVSLGVAALLALGFIMRPKK